MSATAELRSALSRRRLRVLDRLAEVVVLYAGGGIGSRLKYIALRMSGARVSWPLHIDSNVWIRCPHWLVAGRGLVISRGTVINCSAPVVVGSDCLIGYASYIGTAAHTIPTSVADPVARAGHEHHSVVLGDGVWIGAHASVLPGVELGEGCVVGAGAVVTHSFASGSVITGVPGRLSRSRSGRDGDGPSTAGIGGSSA